MKKLNSKSIATIVSVFALALAGPIVALAAGPSPVNLLSAGNFVVLAETAITTTGVTSIVGDIGISPNGASSLTGFGQILDSSGTFSTSALVTGKIYAADYTPPTPAKMTTAINDMLTAYNNAAGRPLPNGVNLGAGVSDKDIGGLTFAPGLYKWDNAVVINSNVILSGGPNDVWIFQIAGDLSIASGGDVISGVKVVLTGGAKASNVFWQVGGGAGATLGTYSTFHGTILSAKQVIMQDGAVLNGRALAQSQVTLIANSISIPTRSNNNILGEIHGSKFEDMAGDAVLNKGDGRLSGWTMYLDANDDGDLDVGESFAVTDTNGNYRFIGLAAGTYHVREVLLPGWVQTYPSLGKHDIALAAGQISKLNNFGNFHLGSISGRTYEDKNGNGRQNTGEGGLAGWTIHLKKVGSATATVTTDVNGNYTFPDLGPGVYQLSEVLQPGWKQTDRPNQVCSIRSGSVLTRYNFGNKQIVP